MGIKGYQGVSLLDFPGGISTVFFVGGCNFRCPFCHNPSLVLRPGELPDIGSERALDLVEERKGFIDGVVVGGGEPLLYPDLPGFLRAVKDIGLATKVDTNASLPDRLEKLLEQGLVDYWAVDIKTSPAKYGSAAGVDVAIEDIMASIGLLKSYGARVEFRTTCVPGIVDPDDIPGVGEMIRGSDLLVLQPFNPEVTLDPSCGKIRPYTDGEMEDLAELARGYVKRVIVKRA